MSYVDSHLLPGERVVHRTTLHPIIFLASALTAAVALLLLAYSETRDGGWFVLAVLPFVFLINLIRFKSSEFAVTSTRVVIKVGWLTRKTIELQLSKVESIGVEQDLIGRILDYGTIVVVGTGGTNEPFSLIRAPIEFRTQVQGEAEVVANANSRIASGQRAEVSPAAAQRVERECPHCAETILAKANLCRFCGQAVIPTVPA